MPVEKEFGDSDNLLELGLSSIVIMRLVNQWRKQGVKVAFGTLMEHPTLNEWWEIIQKIMKKKEKKAKAEMITQVKHLFETEYKKECEEGNMHLLAASSAGAEETAQWVAEIQEAFPGMEVLSDPLACSISCHIGPGGLGIGFSCRP